jgi:hypothetical protein
MAEGRYALFELSTKLGVSVATVFSTTNERLAPPSASTRQTESHWSAYTTIRFKLPPNSGWDEFPQFFV